MRALRVAGAIAAITLSGVAGLAGTASATHAGETIVVSKTTGLADGETVHVTVSNFTPAAKPVKIVIAGQATFTGVPSKLNFTEYAAAPTITLAADGTGEADYAVKIDHGMDNDGNPLVCGKGGQQCWLIAVQEPFLPQPNYASQEITFGDAAPTGPTVTIAAPTTTAAVTTTTAPPVETTTTTAKATVTVTDDSKDNGSNTGLIVGIAAGAVVVLGGLGFAMTRRSGGNSGGATPPPPL